MSYTSIVDGVIDVIERAEGFDRNVTENDYSLLNSGLDRAAVVVLGGMTQARIAYQGVLERRWTINVQVFTGVHGDIEATKARQRSDRQAILDTLSEYPLLNSADDVLLSEIASLTFETAQRTFGDASYLMEAFALNVLETVIASEVE